MKLRSRIWAFLAAAVLTGLADGAHAHEAVALTGGIQATDANAISKGQSVVAGKIAADFQSFAGSSENATSLVTGLGTEVLCVTNTRNRSSLDGCEGLSATSCAFNPLRHLLRQGLSIRACSKYAHVLHGTFQAH
jgi:hypothetical protein